MKHGETADICSSRKTICVTIRNTPEKVSVKAKVTQKSTK